MQEINLYQVFLFLTVPMAKKTPPQKKNTPHVHHVLEMKTTKHQSLISFMHPVYIFSLCSANQCSKTAWLCVTICTTLWKTKQKQEIFSHEQTWTFLWWAPQSMSHPCVLSRTPLPVLLWVVSPSAWLLWIQTLWFSPRSHLLIQGTDRF